MTHGSSLLRGPGPIPNRFIWAIVIIMGQLAVYVFLLVIDGIVIIMGQLAVYVFLLVIDGIVIIMGQLAVYVFLLVIDGIVIIMGQLAVYVFLLVIDGIVIIMGQLAVYVFLLVIDGVNSVLALSQAFPHGHRHPHGAVGCVCHLPCHRWHSWGPGPIPSIWANIIMGQLAVYVILLLIDGKPCAGTWPYPKPAYLGHRHHGPGGCVCHPPCHRWQAGLHHGAVGCICHSPSHRWQAPCPHHGASSWGSWLSVFNSTPR